MSAGRCGSGGGGGGIHGAVTLDGGGGAALITVMGAVEAIRETGGDGTFVADVELVREVCGDVGFVTCIIFAARDVGGDGGLVTGGLRTRFMVLVGCGIVIVSFRQSCDWCKDGGVDTRTGDERGSLMLCARATFALFVKFSFLGGGDGFCREGDGSGLLGTMTDFANPLTVVSELLTVESVVLCPCFISIIL